jgi:hypothetical protein
MQLLIRAIITGFGYRLGAELGRVVAERSGLAKPTDAGKRDNLDEGVGTTPPSQTPEPDDDDGTPRASFVG